MYYTTPPFFVSDHLRNYASYTPILDNHTSNKSSVDTVGKLLVTAVCL